MANERDREPRFEGEEGASRRRERRRPNQEPYGRDTDLNRGYNAEGEYRPDYTDETDYDRRYDRRRGELYGYAGREYRKVYGPERYRRRPFEEDESRGPRYERRRREEPFRDRRGEPFPEAERDWDESEYGIQHSSLYEEMSRAFRTGRYAGAGPRGYERSDERILEDVNFRLTQHGWIDATGVEVEVNDREVTLNGVVNSRREKRLAEDVADSVPGIRDVHNRLRIRHLVEESQAE